MNTGKPICSWRDASRKKTGSGGDFYVVAGSRLGNRFPAMVYAAVSSGKLSYTEAYDLTDLHGKSFTKFGKDRGYIA